MSAVKGFYEFLLRPGAPRDGPSYSNLPLTGAALPIILISIVYAVFVLKIGPQWMKTRQPFQLKNVILAYNLAQIVINLFIVLGSVFVIASTDELEIGCCLKLRVDHPLKLLEVAISYAYVLTKIVDYMDTIFFVLRKSFKQITFLHVYHHIMMALISYLYAHFYGSGGHTGLIAVINSFVHAVMYTYYLQSALRPDTQKSLWWKKYITKLQLTQFAIILVHQLWPLLVRRDCNYPRIWLYSGTTQAIVMLYLFGKFYKNAYLRKNTGTKEHKLDPNEKIAAKVL